MVVGTGDPVKRGVEGIDCTDACKGHVDHIASLETIASKSVLVTLSQHVNNVGGRRFGAVKG